MGKIEERHLEREQYWEDTGRGKHLKSLCENFHLDSQDGSLVVTTR